MPTSPVRLLCGLLLASAPLAAFAQSTVIRDDEVLDGDRPEAWAMHYMTASTLMTAFGQHGAVVGDVTCPADLANVQDTELNPYGCEAPSSDTLALNYYGLETTAALQHGPWTWHLTGGVVRMENEVQVDAMTYGFRDYSRLTATDDVGYVAFGVGRAMPKGWGLAAEVLYVPLTVNRPAENSQDNDPMLSFRLQVRYAFDAP